MSNKRFIKTKSNYTLKKKVLSTDMGSIYERDYMTINKDGSNFKFTLNTSPSYQKKHSSFDEGETESQFVSVSVQSPESNVIIKPDNESLKNFAFYGSSKELVRVSVENILLNFPAEAILLPDGKVENPYGIDFFTSKVVSTEAYNRMRYMSTSWKDYMVIVDGKENKLDSWSVWSESSGNDSIICPDFDDIFHCTISFGEHEINLTKMYDHLKEEWSVKHDFSGMIFNEIRIRPSSDMIKDAFSRFSEFEGLLVNPETNPVYTVTLDTPIEDESGIAIYKKNYTWPSERGYNPDPSGFLFENYYSSLLSVAEFFDEYYTDNIWETMVHDSMKNMDYTFTRKSNGEQENAGLDSGKLRPILEAWGYQFDFLKRHIDSIGFSNRTTYNEKDNAPDYMLKSKLDLNGWDVKQVNPDSSKNEVTGPLFPTRSVGGTGIEANSQFFKELQLNSKYIFPRKGTKEAIRAVMGLFGISEDDYIINEFISVATPKEGNSYPDFDYVKYFNKSDEKIIDGNELLGLPLKKVELVGEKETKKYVVPWFNNGEIYDGRSYFQMKGGWDEKESKYVKNPFSGNVILLEKEDGLGLYEETSPILKIFNDINSISFGFKGFLKPKEVMYMTNIEGLDLVYKNEFGEKYSMDEFSHYFVLDNNDCGYTLGYDDINQCYGWKNVLLDEFDDDHLSLNAKRVLYMESLKEITEGNNPHAGYYQYDSGKDYMDLFRSVYKNTDLNYLSDEDTKKALDIGFSVNDRVIDNRKVWYFDDTIKDTDSDIFVSGVTSGLPENDPWARKENMVDDVKEINPFNPEGGEANDEAAANSIINNKFLQIIVFTPFFGKDEDPEKVKIFREDMKRYMNDVVFFYVKQVVPSTSIVRFSVLDRDIPGSESLCYDTECEKPYYRPPITGVVMDGEPGYDLAVPNDRTEDGQESVKVLDITEGIKIMDKDREE